ncbi:transposable element Tcb1 transposase [Trichonephila clavipes]|nr:transposable element Tcb1 transposase [Trichonephila clavipes]
MRQGNPVLTNDVTRIGVRRLLPPSRHPVVKGNDADNRPTQRKDRGLHSVSARTIRRRLQQSGLSVRRPLLGLPLTQNHRRLRRQWCDEKRMWAAEWNEVVFTDESRICLQHHDGRIRVWRHRGERMLNSCVMHSRNGPAPAATLDQLWQRVEATWSAVPREHIQSLFESMPSRVAAVISNNAGYSEN